jgi:hypothetical protein
LSVITPDKIRATPNSIRHISTIFVKRLYDLGFDVGQIDTPLEIGIINEIRTAITQGIVLYSYASDDTFNPLDRQLEIYTYANLHNINPGLNGIAKLRVICRLSVSSGMLMLRTIDKTFQAG